MADQLRVMISSTARALPERLEKLIHVCAYGWESFIPTRNKINPHDEFYVGEAESD